MQCVQTKLTKSKKCCCSVLLLSVLVMCIHRLCNVRHCMANHFLCFCVYDCVCDTDHESAIKTFILGYITITFVESIQMWDLLNALCVWTTLICCICFYLV